MPFSQALLAAQAPSVIYTGTLLQLLSISISGPYTRISSLTPCALLWKSSGFLDENIKAIIAFQTGNKILSDYDSFSGTICVLPK